MLSRDPKQAIKMAKPSHVRRSAGQVAAAYANGNDDWVYHLSQGGHSPLISFDK
jgi:hypothetical protein